MSLSKYYQNSDSFQPEGIVKRLDTPLKGWENSVINQQPSDFETDSPVNELSANPTRTEDNADNSGNADHPVPESSTVLDSPASQDQDPGQEIDLSKYVENSLAEKRIEEAYQKGVQDSETRAAEDFGAAVRALLSSCQQLDTVRETLIVNNRAEVLDFALAIAERILRISVQEQDGTIIATIEEALQRAVKSDEFTIYIHPDDYETVENKAAELITGFSGLNSIVVKKDITIEQGGAKIESNNCTIDATIGSQYNVIREELKRKL